jgi:hypothetical protein
MRFSVEALALLDRQLGLITRPQLLALGYRPKQVDAMLRRGHLEAVLHGTYRRTGAGIPIGQDALAAVLRCRPSARMTGLLVLAMLGAEGVDPEDAPYTVLIPPDRSVQNVPFRVRPDAAPALHHASYGAIPGTTPARTLIERAVEVDDDAQLLLDFDRLRWRGCLDRRRLASTIDDLPGHPGAERWAALLTTDGAQQESPGERNLAAALSPLEPPLEWQVWVAPDLRVDALWRDVAIVIEYDGRNTHNDQRDRRTDARRHARLRQLGYLVIAVTSADLEDPSALRARLLRVRSERLVGGEAATSG